MSILNQLSSQVGDRSTKSNLRVSAECLAQPALLDEVVGGLASKDAALAGDCAEVFTEVAKAEPGLVVPYAEALSALLTHRHTRVRWEAMHALALVAAGAPEVITSLLSRLRDIIRRDSSVIVRDYAVDALGNYAKTSKEAAEAAHPVLVEALTLWSGKQAARALSGLANVVSAIPSLSDELRVVAAEYENNGCGVVRKAAKVLIRATQLRGEVDGP
jgi:hypothetical protein